jgi:hypothetical protein
MFKLLHPVPETGPNQHYSLLKLWRLFALAAEEVVVVATLRPQQLPCRAAVAGVVPLGHTDFIRLPILGLLSLTLLGPQARLERLARVLVVATEVKAVHPRSAAMF